MSVPEWRPLATCLEQVDRQQCVRFAGHQCRTPEKSDGFGGSFLRRGKSPTTNSLCPDESPRPFSRATTVHPSAHPLAAFERALRPLAFEFERDRSYRDGRGIQNPGAPFRIIGRSKSPSLALSSRPTGATQGTSWGNRSSTVCRPCSSDAVVTIPRGLFNRK